MLHVKEAQFAKNEICYMFVYGIVLLRTLINW